MTKVLLTFMALCYAFAAHAQHGHGEPDKPSVHGMVIFGTKQVYASHLPLFHTPHDYQAILALSLDKKTLRLLQKDQKEYAAYATYTIEPERFILPEMIERKGTFKANIYRGHFERGGVKIASEVSIQITEVIYFQKLDASKPKDAEAKYIVFGNEQEQFAIHQIGGKPDFEQILQVSAPAKTAITTLGDSNTPVGVSSQQLKNGIALLRQLYLEFEDLK